MSSKKYSTSFYCLLAASLLLFYSSLFYGDESTLSDNILTPVPVKFYYLSTLDHEAQGTMSCISAFCSFLSSKTNTADVYHYESVNTLDLLPDALIRVPYYTSHIADTDALDTASAIWSKTQEMLKNHVSDRALPSDVINLVLMHINAKHFLLVINKTHHRLIHLNTLKDQPPETISDKISIANIAEKTLEHHRLSTTTSLSGVSNHLEDIIRVIKQPEALKVRASALGTAPGNSNGCSSSESQNNQNFGNRGNNNSHRSTLSAFGRSGDDGKDPDKPSDYKKRSRCEQDSEMPEENHTAYQEAPSELKNAANAEPSTSSNTGNNSQCTPEQTRRDRTAYHRAHRPASAASSRPVRPVHPNAVQDWLVKGGNMKSEYDRIKTFRYSSFKWPHHHQGISPEAMAASGFFLLGGGGNSLYSDRVQCFECIMIMHQWRGCDSANDWHRRHSPHCDMAHGRSTRNIPLGDNPPPPPLQSPRNEFFQPAQEPGNSHSEDFSSGLFEQFLDRVPQDRIDALFDQLIAPANDPSPERIELIITTMAEHNGIEINLEHLREARPRLPSINPDDLMRRAARGGDLEDFDRQDFLRLVEEELFPNQPGYLIPATNHQTSAVQQQPENSNILPVYERITLRLDEMGIPVNQDFREVLTGIINNYSSDSDDFIIQACIDHIFTQRSLILSSSSSNVATTGSPEEPSAPNTEVLSEPQPHHREALTLAQMHYVSSTAAWDEESLSTVPNPTTSTTALISSAASMQQDEEAIERVENLIQGVNQRVAREWEFAPNFNRNELALLLHESGRNWETINVDELFGLLANHLYSEVERSSLFLSSAMTSVNPEGPSTSGLNHHHHNDANIDSNSTPADGKDVIICPICRESNILPVIFTPCTHTACKTCSSKITKCPICRRKIEKTSTPFYSTK